MILIEEQQKKENIRTNVLLEKSKELTNENIDIDSMANFINKYIQPNTDTIK